MDRGSRTVKFSISMSILDHCFYKFSLHWYWVRTLACALSTLAFIPFSENFPVFKNGLTPLCILKLGSRWS